MTPKTLGRHRLEDPLAVSAGGSAGPEGVQVWWPMGSTAAPTAFDDHTADCDRNGAARCRQFCTAMRRSIWLILMLGTNDMKPV